jgi:hypothetical protein
MHNNETLYKQTAACLDPKNKRREGIAAVGFEEVRTGGPEHHKITTMSDEGKDILTPAYWVATQLAFYKSLKWKANSERTSAVRIRQGLYGREG